MNRDRAVQLTYFLLRVVAGLLFLQAAFPLPVDFPAIEVTLVAFVASVRNDAQSLA